MCSKNKEREYYEAISFLSNLLDQYKKTYGIIVNDDIPCHIMEIINDSHVRIEKHCLSPVRSFIYIIYMYIMNSVEK